MHILLEFPRPVGRKQGLGLQLKGGTGKDKEDTKLTKKEGLQL